MASSYLLFMLQLHVIDLSLQINQFALQDNQHIFQFLLALQYLGVLFTHHLHLFNLHNLLDLHHLRIGPRCCCLGCLESCLSLRFLGQFVRLLSLLPLSTYLLLQRLELNLQLILRVLQVLLVSLFLHLNLLLLVLKLPHETLHLLVALVLNVRLLVYDSLHRSAVRLRTLTRQLRVFQSRRQQVQLLHLHSAQGLVVHQLSPPQGVLNLDGPLAELDGVGGL
mmetsp:Transcript_27941/g.53165  ORF Transcript_27941/g.53165 Transcript_27941/m.53165 type:complete len:223 (+) Transcript_27941:753-1421(+)